MRAFHKVLTVAALSTVASGGLMTTQETEAEATPPETLTDGCSGEVAFPPTYDQLPTTPGTAVLKRGPDGYSPWTTFRAQPDGSGHVRWYCHSTIGNVFDVGTWRVHVDASGAFACLLAATGSVDANVTTSCLKSISVGSSAFQGWTPERSRCVTGSNYFRARLGPDRLLQTQCLGAAPPLPPTPPPPAPPGTVVNPKVINPGALPPAPPPPPPPPPATVTPKAINPGAVPPAPPPPPPPKVLPKVITSAVPSAPPAPPPTPPPAAPRAPAPGGR
jgi:hypothetical protein